MGSSVIWMIHICWLASGPDREGFQSNLLTLQFPGYIFYHSFLKYDNPIYLYPPHLFEGGGHRIGTANKVRGSNALIQFDFNTLPASVLHCCA